MSENFIIDLPANIAVKQPIGKLKKIKRGYSLKTSDHVHDLAVVRCRTADNRGKDKETGVDPLCDGTIMQEGFEINRGTIAKGCVNA